MTAFWHRLRFYVGDAWEELRHSPGVNLLAVGTLITVLFGAGLIALVLSNVETWTNVPLNIHRPTGSLPSAPKARRAP